MRAGGRWGAVLLAGAAGVAALAPVLWATALPAGAFTSSVNIVDKAKPDPNGDGLFDPSVITINVGTKVLWTNKTSTRHTVTSNPGSITFDSGDLRGPGGQFEFRFDAAGSYPYHCTRHPNMIGRVDVVDPNAPTTTTTPPPPPTAPPTTTT
ncbi:MAG TPA: plastocyanin/azurin family copper-binding protein, partial [Acidimicrobiia bacterium]|nr:plastocyanin/azurin family copper-binding protein [Acidimicrobiia bacterium]